eukprot:m.97692 g.97692  ORF g.97692 m.97692 type:complete len:314 (+) comp12405_c0_seq3:1293-2234(+)
MVSRPRSGDDRTLAIHTHAKDITGGVVAPSRAPLNPRGLHVGRAGSHSGTTPGNAKFINVNVTIKLTRDCLVVLRYEVGIPGTSRNASVVERASTRNQRVPDTPTPESLNPLGAADITRGLVAQDVHTLASGFRGRELLLEPNELRLAFDIRSASRGPRGWVHLHPIIDIQRDQRKPGDGCRAHGVVPPLAHRCHCVGVVFELGKPCRVAQIVVQPRLASACTVVDVAGCRVVVAQTAKHLSVREGCSHRGKIPGDDVEELLLRHRVRTYARGARTRLGKISSEVHCCSVRRFRGHKPDCRGKQILGRCTVAL